MGHLANAWIEHFVVHGPGDVHGQPVRHGQEFYDFVVDCYALTSAGRPMYDSAFLSRPKGCDKSGLGARFALLEAMGPCRFAGWAKGGEVFEDPWELGFRYEYHAGEPMGRPVQDAFVRCMATEEGQTGNVYDTIYLNLTEDDAPLSHVPGVDAGFTWTVLPNGATIIPSTASAAHKDGGKETFVMFDESHLYDTPVLREMYGVVTRNLRKRKRIAGTWYLETTTMFEKGADSIAERTYQLAEAIEEGRARSERLLFDHRWGECEDLSAEDMLRAAILEAFGEAIEWNDIDGIVEEFYDPRAATSKSRRYFLNAPTAAGDSWLAPHEWASRLDATATLAKGDAITLGFDGSRSRAQGVADATALVACRVSDGCLFELRVWEQPEGVQGRGWHVPVVEVEAELDQAFRDHNVVGFFADPAKWESYVAAWEAKWGSRLKVKATVQHPIEWWMVGGRALAVVRALQQFETAVVDGGVTHDGSAKLTRHVLNARRRVSKSGIQIAKEHPDSEKKIDAAVAAVLAFEARTLAVAMGAGRQMAVPRRIR